MPFPNGAVSLLDSHDERLSNLEAGQRELLPAVARVEAQLGSVAALVERIDTKVDALASVQTQDGLKVKALEVKADAKEKTAANWSYAAFTALAAVVADVALHLLKGFK